MEIAREISKEDVLFFKESAHFKFISHELVPILLSKQERVKVWCCTAATGEDIYSLAMVLDKQFGGMLDFKVLATDVDVNLLKKAKNGVYPNSKLSEIPKTHQTQYTVLGKNTAEGFFKINNKLHSLIEFKQHNLVEATYPGDDVFDMIFCQNVLSSFEPNRIELILQKLHRSLKPGGVLFIGHSESLPMPQRLFKSVQAAVYRKL